MMPLPELLRLGDIFLISFAVAALAAYPVYKLLIAWKSRQTVSQYAPEGHQKKQGTPTMGGIIIVIGAAGGLLAYLLLGDPSRVSPALATTQVALILCLGFALIGFLDDFIVPRLIPSKRGLGWKQKILMQILVAGLGMGLLYQWKLGLEFWIGLFLVLFFSNAYNFADGLDGLAGSLLLTLGLGLAALSVHAGAALDVPIAIAALMGAVIPFLFINAPPARVFMGDVGSLPVGACLGLVVAELITQRSYEPAGVASGIDWWMTVPVAIASFIMIAELVPVPLQILSVKLRKKKLFTYTPIHHAFEAKGWPESRVVWTFALMQLVLSGGALYAFARITEARHGP